MPAGFTPGGGASATAFFATGSGQLPYVVARRIDRNSRSITLKDTPPRQRAILFTGAPGMGKSVELTRAERDAQGIDSLIVRVDASPREPLEIRFSRAVLTAMPAIRDRYGRRAARQLKKFAESMAPGQKFTHSGGDVRVGMPPLTVSANHGVEEMTDSAAGHLTELADRLIALDPKRPVVLMVDNVDVASDRDLAVVNELATYVQDDRADDPTHLHGDGRAAGARNIHLVVAGGERSAARLLGASQSLTGVEAGIGQLYDIRECRPLDDEQAVTTLAEPFGVGGIVADPMALEDLVKSANGNPRRLQQLGAAAAELAEVGRFAAVGEVDRATAAAAVAQVNTDSHVIYEALWDNSSAIEKDLVARTAMRGSTGLSMAAVSRDFGSNTWTAADEARQSLKARGILRQEDGSDRVSIADPGLQEWVDKYVGPSVAHLGVAMTGLARPGSSPHLGASTAVPGRPPRSESPTIAR